MELALIVAVILFALWRICNGVAEAKIAWRYAVGRKREAVETPTLRSPVVSARAVEALAPHSFTQGVAMGTFIVPQGNRGSCPRTRSGPHRDWRGDSLPWGPIPRPRMGRPRPATKKALMRQPRAFAPAAAFSFIKTIF